MTDKHESERPSAVRSSDFVSTQQQDENESVLDPSVHTVLDALRKNSDYLPISACVQSLLCPHSIERHYQEKMCRLQRKAKLALDLWRQHGCPELREPTGTNRSGDNLLEYACDEMLRVCGANDRTHLPPVTGGTNERKP